MKPPRILSRIKENPLVVALRNLRGNPRTLVMIEPFWGIPYNLIAPFVTVYMYALGVTDVQIGLLLSCAMVMQVICSFFGGIITDKIGRKNTTMLGDILGWVIPCLIWAVAQNFWFFLVAILLNSFEQVNQTAWYCLLIEDADKRSVVNIFSWITIAGLLAVFFSPISGALIGTFTLVPVVRVLYICFSLGMAAKSFITWRYTAETRQGIVRRAETKDASVLSMIAGYRKLIPTIFRNRDMLRTLAIMVILMITGMVTGNFFALYVSKDLGVPDQFLAFFPIVRAAVMLVFMFTVQHRLSRLKLKRPMMMGIVIYILCQVILLASPPKQMVSIIIYTALEAVAYALVGPRKDTIVTLYVDPNERARIVALMTAFMTAFASPFGYIAGLLSSVDRRLPFLMNIVLFIALLFVIASLRERDDLLGEDETLDALDAPSPAQGHRDL